MIQTADVEGNIGNLPIPKLPRILVKPTQEILIKMHNKICINDVSVHSNMVRCYHCYQDYIHNIPSIKYKKIFLEEFTNESFPLFMYTSSIELKIRNQHFAPNIV